MQPMCHYERSAVGVTRALRDDSVIHKARSLCRLRFLATTTLTLHLAGSIGAHDMWLAVGLFQQQNFANDQIGAGVWLEQVVQRQRADAGGSQCFHFETGFGVGLDFHSNGDGCFVEVIAHLDALQRQRVTQRNQFGCALGGEVNGR